MRLPSKSKPYLLLLPSLVFVVVFLGFGASQLFIASLQSGEGVWSFDNYRQLLTSQVFQASLLASLGITLLATLLSLALGLLLTRVIYFYLAQQWLRSIVWVPMLLPHFAAAYLVLLFFSQSGILSSIFYQLNLLEELTQFPVLTNDPWGIGIILAYLWKEIPFVILVLLPLYHSLNKAQLEVVRTLGGNGWAAFKAVEWPLVSPLLAEIGLILFAFILTAYEIPFLLGVTYPKALAVLGYEWYYAGDWSQRPLSMALFALLTFFSLLLAYLLAVVNRRKRWQGTRGRF